MKVIMMRVLLVFSVVLLSVPSAASADTVEERVQSLIEDISKVPHDDDQNGDHVVGEEMC